MEPRIARAAAGFTLIELMVVVAVLSLLTLSVSLSLSRPGGDRAEDWARFAQLHDRLRAGAVLSGAPAALELDALGYRLLRREGGIWVPEGPRTAWRRPVAVIAPAGGDQRVVFAPGGQSTAVMLRFASALCRSDGWSALNCSGA